MSNIAIKATGTVVEGKAGPVTAQMLREAKKEVAQETVDEVKNVLGSVLKNPTGYYESRIRASNLSSDPVVDDSGVIYGAWLEGVGSRNATSRFKGYYAFRRTAQLMNRRAGQITNRVVSRHMGRLQ